MFSGSFKLRQGKPFSLVFALTEADAPNITGLLVRSQIRDYIGGAIMAEFTNALGNVVVDAVNKKVTIALSSNATAAIAGPLDPATWVMDAEIYNGTSGLVVVDLGSWYVQWEPEVTK